MPMIIDNLVTLIAADVPLKKVASTHGGEYAGPCPFCGGTDRFRVWPNAGQTGRYKCMGYAEGRSGCGRSGDAIQYLRDHHHLSYQAACEQQGLARQPLYAQRPSQTSDGAHPTSSSVSTPSSGLLAPPNDVWQAAAWQLVRASRAHLHAAVGNKALGWLQRRGLEPATIWQANLGYNPTDQYQTETAWGLPPAVNQHGAPRRVWLPRGIVIPWLLNDQLWRVNIRRPHRSPKYVGPAGWQNALYYADPRMAGMKGVGTRPVVLVEGELDALTVHQAIGDQVVAVATGGTGGARHLKWMAWLAVAPLVLIAYDADEAGEKAAGYWLDVLPNAKRWRPFWQDANDMVQGGADVRTWIEVGLGKRA